MKKIIPLLLALALVLSMVACTSSAPAASDTPAAPTDTDVAQTQQQEADPSDAPEQAADAAQTLYLYADAGNEKVEFPWYNLRLPCILMYRSLVIANPTETAWEADMAESYTISDDGMTYTFVLQDGLKWSDGEALTADDIVWNIETALKAAQVASAFTSCFGYIEGAQEFTEGTADHISGIAVDGNTITFTLTAPYAYFLKNLANFSFLPKHCLEDQDPLELYQCDFWSAPVTSGYYKFGEMVVGSYYTMVLNEYYTGTAPKIEKVVVNFTDSALTAVTTGASDYAFFNSASDLDVANADPDLTGYYNEYLFYRYFVFNICGTDGNENPAMQDVNVRKAIALAIDQNALAELYKGAATAQTSGVPISDPDNSGDGLGYDPERAKALLDEAGWDWDYTLRILYYNKDDTTKNLIQAVIYYLESIGMKVESTLSEDGTTDLFTTRNYDIGFKGTGPLDVYYSEFASTSETFKNIYGGDTDFDAPIAALMSASKPEDVTAAKQALQKLEMEKVYKVPLVTIGYMNYVNTSRVAIPESVTDLGCPGHRVDMEFASWYIK